MADEAAVTDPNAAAVVADPAAVAATAVTADKPETLLTPDVDKTATPGGTPGEWKEYEADPAKSDDENATATAEHDKTKPEEKKPEGAPEKYEAFKLPEGVEADPAALEAFMPLAKELNLSQEQAQKLVDFQAANVAKAAKAQQDVWTETNEKWVADAKADPEIGGVKFDENVADAKKFIKAFGTPELFEALAFTGAGNHKEFIRMAARAYKAIGEDKIVTAGNPAGGKKAPAQILFGDTTPSQA